MAGQAGTEHPVDTWIAAAAVAVVVCAALLSGVAEVAGVLFGAGPLPHVTAGIALGAIFGVFKHLSDPRLAWPLVDQRALPGAPGYYTALLLVLGLCGLVFWAGWALWDHHGHLFKAGPQRQKPLVERKALAAHMGSEHVRSRSSQLRPALERTKDMTAHGVYLGRSVDHGVQIYATWEDSVLVWGPPRSGKSSSLIIPGVIESPGPCVVTSTRPDVLRATQGLRARNGDIAVFDPAGLAPGTPTLRWDPVAGCEDPATAIRRAGGFLSGGAANAQEQFWHDKGEMILRCMLHAAALDGRTIADVRSWMANVSERAPDRILSSHPDAAPGWGDELSGEKAGAQVTLGGIMSHASKSLVCFALPQVLAACSPPKGTGWDPISFLAAPNTLFALGSEAASANTAPLLSTLIGEVADAARQRAATSPSGRLDPPVCLWLDEVCNIAPLHDLPSLVSSGGGDGIVTVPVIQALSQARSRWGDGNAQTIKSAATVRIVLPGVDDANDLREICALAGEVDVEQVSTSSGLGGTSRSVSMQRRPALTPDQVRSLPLGHAWVIGRTLAPVEVELSPWMKRPYADEIRSALGTSPSVKRRKWSLLKRVPRQGDVGAALIKGDQS
ncbi:MAG: TraM recognition domain-containing protein [Actinomycetota bacterium]|nr:TraM recognition domain-containing protein [Actinomycetota bacterium]